MHACSYAFVVLGDLIASTLQALTQVATSVDLDDFPIPTKERSARTAVIAYTATFFSGMPFQVRRKRKAARGVCFDAAEGGGVSPRWN
jgi:hypothetical protein